MGRAQGLQSSVLLLEVQDFFCKETVITSFSCKETKEPKKYASRRLQAVGSHHDPMRQPCAGGASTISGSRSARDCGGRRVSEISKTPIESESLEL